MGKRTVKPVAAPLYVIGERSKWIKYIEDGQEDDPIQFEAKVRKNLSSEEVEPLFWGTDITDPEAWEIVAPFVLDWNIAVRNEQGEIEKVSPPAEAGGEQFRLIPTRCFIAIAVDLRIKSTGMVKAKSSTPPAPVDEQSGVEHSNLTAEPNLSPGDLPD